jgi:hypothetical protein
MGLLDRPKRPVTGLLSSYPFTENFGLSSPAVQMPKQFDGMWAARSDGLRAIPYQRDSHVYSRAEPASEQQIEMAQLIVPIPVPGRPVPPGTLPPPGMLLPPGPPPPHLPPPKLPPISLPPISLRRSIPLPLPWRFILPLLLPRIGGDDPPQSPPSDPPRTRRKSKDVCEEEKETRDQRCSTALRSKQGIARCKSRSFTLYGDCLAGKLEGRFDPRDFAHYQ